LKDAMATLRPLDHSAKVTLEPNQINSRDRDKG
jgi:hypothetical protein